MKNRLQFSVGTLLLVTALVAVVLWLTYRVPASIGAPVLTLLTVTFPAFLTITAIYGDKSMRPFCIGALFPMVPSLLNGGSYSFNWKTFQDPGQVPGLDPSLIPEPDSFAESDQAFMGLSLIAAVAIGFLCSLLQWWLTRNDRGQVLRSLAVPDPQAVRNAA